MGEKHSSAAIASETNFIQRFSDILFLIHVHDLVLELLPFVGDHFAAAEATYWDYHLFSPIFKLLSNSTPVFLILIYYQYTHTTLAPFKFLTILYSTSYYLQLTIMRAFPNTEDQSFMDKLESKTRQLLFKFGSEEDPDKRKLYEEQITKYNKLMKQIQPYYRYQRLATEEKNLRLCLQDTENTLGDLKADLAKKQNQNKELSQMKAQFEQLIEQVVRGKEYENKIQALNSQIKLIEDIGKFEDSSFIDNGILCISQLKKQLIHKKDQVNEEKTEVRKLTERLQKEIQREQQQWEKNFERKNVLLNALEKEKAKSVSVEIRGSLDRKSIRSQPQEPRQTYQIRKKKLKFNQIEQKKSQPILYIIWTLILLVWVWWILPVSKMGGIGKDDEKCY